MAISGLSKNQALRQARKIFASVLILFALLSTFSVAAQRRPISGIVIDKVNNEPLMGVGICIENTTKWSVTDKNGEFSFSDIGDAACKAEVSYLGYVTQVFDIPSKAQRSNTLIFKLEQEVKSLGEVVIVGKSKARIIREQALPVSVISMSQMQGTGSSMADLFPKLAGITVRATGGVGSASRISVRGLEGKRIGMFLDGFPMSDNADFMDINDIPVEMIDRIEIYKGVVPARLGGSAIGGAVNVILREYPPKYLDVNYSFGSYNTHKVSLVSKRNIPQKGYEFGLGGTYIHSDNDYKMEIPSEKNHWVRRDHDKFDKLLVGGSFKARKWWFDLVELEPVYVRTYKQLQGIETNIREAYSASDGYIMHNKMERKDFFADGLDLVWDIAYMYSDSRFTDIAPFRIHWDGTQYPAVSELGGETNKWASHLVNRKQTLKHKINLDYLLTANHTLNFNSVFNYAHGDPNDPLKEQVLGYRTNFKSDMLNWAAGVNYDYRTTNDKFLNSLSVKYYLYNVATRLASVVSPAVTDVAMRKSDFGANNSMRYRFTPVFMAKASAAYDVRLPAENELLGDGYVIAPAGNLEPERNTSVNLGLLLDKTGVSPSNLQIELSGYYMYLQNMIRFTGGYLQSQYQNFGEMRTFGVEAEIKADMTRWLYGYANVTYQDLRDARRHEQNTTRPNPNYGKRMPNVPYLTANAGLEFHRENLFGGKGMNTRVFGDCMFVERYYYDFEESRFQDRSIPRSLTFNVGFEQGFCHGRYFLICHLNNITNAKTLSEFNRPLPGRNFLIRLRYVFK